MKQHRHYYVHKIIMPIYVFQLEEDKKYVYHTDIVDSAVALRKVVLDFDSLWIVKYRPRYVKETYLDKGEWEYQEAVLLAMVKYGIENVRGGAYNQCELSDTDVIIAKRTTGYLKNTNVIKMQKVTRGYLSRGRGGKN